MVTVLRERGLHVIIYKSDHLPPHVHVFGDKEVKIALEGAGGEPEVMGYTLATFAESRRAVRLVREHQACLLKRWSEIHG